MGAPRPGASSRPGGRASPSPRPSPGCPAHGDADPITLESFPPIYLSALVSPDWRPVVCPLTRVEPCRHGADTLLGVRSLEPWLMDTLGRRQTPENHKYIVSYGTAAPPWTLHWHVLKNSRSMPYVHPRPRPFPIATHVSCCCPQQVSRLSARCLRGHCQDTQYSPPPFSQSRARILGPHSMLSKSPNGSGFAQPSSGQRNRDACTVVSTFDSLLPSHMHPNSSQGRTSFRRTHRAPCSRDAEGVSTLRMPGAFPSLG